jgi:4-amino-4-deoxy-L-arabinose transferase-like glycosyltransferase
MLFDRGEQGKVLRISSSPLWAGAIILLALVIRVWLIAQGWPLLDSDEGTMGLMAMHIAYRGEHPFFFYGQAYMGATEAYLAATLFRVFGVSSFTLRLGLLLIFTVFLIAIYLLTCLLYTRRLALVVLLILALGSNPMLVRELVAVGGDPETLMSSAVLMVLAAWLALTYQPDAALSISWKRLLAYTGWGLTAGFSLFSHMLGVPYIIAGAVILVLFCWRELCSRALVLLLIGLCVGASPLIIYNLTLTPTEKSTLFYVVHAESAGGTPIHILQQLKGALLISLPTASGANPLCAVTDVHALNLSSLHGWHCTLVHTGWSVGIVCLWCMAVLSALAMLWQLLRQGPAAWSMEDRREVIRHAVRLLLLVCSGGTLVLYILSPNAALYPVATSRYLIGLLVATPAILWPLWRGLAVLKPLMLSLAPKLTLSPRLEQDSLLVGRGIMAIVVCIFALGTFSTFTGIPAEAPGLPNENVYFTQDATQHLDLPATLALNQQESAFLHELLHMGITHIYSDYWTCDRLIFQSQEHLICAVVNDNLTPGHNRYLPYRSIVDADPNAAYAFRVHTLPDVTFAQHRAAMRPARHYQRLVFDGYAVYVTSSVAERLVR